MVIATRLILALLLAVAGFQLGSSADVINLLPDGVGKAVRYGGLIIIGWVTGFICGGVVGKLVERASLASRAELRERSGAELLVGTLSLLAGLAVSFLLSLPVRELPFVGVYLVLPASLLVAYIFVLIGVDKHVEILRLLGMKVGSVGARSKIIDTSALIDGRIMELSKGGLLEGAFLIPVYVLEELQHMADSRDAHRRARGRRGLEVCEKLRKIASVSTPEDTHREIEAVDSKLVQVARDVRGCVVTVDSGLAKLARAQGVAVINLHEVADGMKPLFVVGDTMQLTLVKEGKDRGQGVGYLDDGTMVVVEDGEQHVGSEQRVAVVSVLQTPTGKLVFARTAGEGEGGNGRA